MNNVTMTNAHRERTTCQSKNMEEKLFKGNAVTLFKKMWLFIAAWFKEILVKSP
jgi:hypothetical protein